MNKKVGLAIFVLFIGFLSWPTKVVTPLYDQQSCPDNPDASCYIPHKVEWQLGGGYRYVEQILQ